MPMSRGPVSVSPPWVVRHLGPQLLGVARRVDAGRGRRGEEVGGVLGVGRPRPRPQPRHRERAGRGRGPPGRGVGGVRAVGHGGHLKVKTWICCVFVSLLCHLTHFSGQGAAPPGRGQGCGCGPGSLSRGRSAHFSGIWRDGFETRPDKLKLRIKVCIFVRNNVTSIMNKIFEFRPQWYQVSERQWHWTFCAIILNSCERLCPNILSCVPMWS